MDPDIENMTISEYLEYEAAKKEIIGQCSIQKKSKKPRNESTRTGAENIKRMGHDIVQDNIWEQDDDSEEDQKKDGDDRDTFDMWDITVEDVERIRKFFNVPDEIDEIILNVAMVDEEADFNPTKDLEELEKLLTKEPQSNFTKIQGYYSEETEFKVSLPYNYVDTNQAARKHLEPSWLNAILDDEEVACDDA
ncbi:hypothetical protein Tco_1049590 [Tanacetum coccineum]